MDELGRVKGALVLANQPATDPAPATSPPVAPHGYEGPSIDLVDESGDVSLHLRCVDDVVIIESANRRRSATTVAELRESVSEMTAGERLTPVSRERPWATQRSHATLLIFLAETWPAVQRDAGAGYHITLSYALPLPLDARWTRWSELNVDLLVATQQLVAVSASDLVAVQPRLEARRRHRRLFRLNQQTEVREHTGIRAFLDEWARFEELRHGYSIDPTDREALYAILSMSGCKVRDFLHSGSTIASTVTCFHAPSNTLFDLMAFWDLTAARLRPGIYTGVSNFLDAASRGARYSLCYGQFPYKDHIVGEAQRLTLEDLLDIRG